MMKIDRLIGAFSGEKELLDYLLSFRQLDKTSHFDTYANEPQSILNAVLDGRKYLCEDSTVFMLEKTLIGVLVHGYFERKVPLKWVKPNLEFTFDYMFFRQFRDSQNYSDAGFYNLNAKVKSDWIPEWSGSECLSKRNFVELFNEIQQLDQKLDLKWKKKRWIEVVESMNPPLDLRWFIFSLIYLPEKITQFFIVSTQIIWLLVRKHKILKIN